MPTESTPRMATYAKTLTGVGPNIITPEFVNNLDKESLLKLSVFVRNALLKNMTGEFTG